MSWTLIESVTLGSTQASVTLGSGGTIPQTYKTLKVVISARSDSGTSFTGIRANLNGSTTSQSSRTLSGNGSAASSATYSTFFAGLVQQTAYTANTFTSSELTLPNYTSSTQNKVGSSESVTENNATEAQQWMFANLWSSTAAVTSVTIAIDGSGNFISGSTFTLYGLK